MSNAISKAKNLAVFMLVMLVFLIPAQQAQAMLPVVDIGAITQLLAELKQLKSMYDNGIDQLNKAKQIASDAEGHYDFGNFENGIQDLDNRKWSPDNWQDALKGLSGGNQARYEQLVDQYKKDNPTLSDDDFRKGASDAKLADYKSQIATNRASEVQAEYAFDDINQHLQNVHDISAKIESATNTKAAIDLNSRLTAELAYISTQELKMLTLINQQLAQQQASNIAAEGESAKFNTLPDK